MLHTKQNRGKEVDPRHVLRCRVRTYVQEDFQHCQLLTPYAQRITSYVRTWPQIHDEGGGSPLDRANHSVLCLNAWLGVNRDWLVLMAPVADGALPPPLRQPSFHRDANKWL